VLHLMSGVEGARRSAVREELEAIGFTPVASTPFPPSPGPVGRPALVNEVRAAEADVVTVTAPAGYGKSTFLAELTAGDPRPTAWVSVCRTENDPAGLLSSVALALDDVEPVDPRCVAALWTRRPTVGSPSLERFRAMVAGCSRPFMLVLDDVHELVDHDVVATLGVLIGDLPPGSTVVLASRVAGVWSAPRRRSAGIRLTSGLDAGQCCTTVPPSTFQDCPVTHAPWSEQR
jgi:LuxR family transcriptional regulator, maltose regulon positive regulatory protein